MSIFTLQKYIKIIIILGIFSPAVSRDRWLGSLESSYQRSGSGGQIQQWRQVGDSPQWPSFSNSTRYPPWLLLTSAEQFVFIGKLVYFFCASKFTRPFKVYKISFASRNVFPHISFFVALDFLSIFFLHILLFDINRNRIIFSTFTKLSLYSNRTYNVHVLYVSTGLHECKVESNRKNLVVIS